MIVKLADFRESGYKQKLLRNCITEGNIVKFGEMCDVMDMSPDEIIVGLLADFDDIKDAGEVILDYLAPRVTRTCMPIFSELLSKMMEYLKTKLPMVQLCELWRSCLFNTIDSIDGLKMMFTVETIRVLMGIRDMEAPDAEKLQLLETFMAKDDAQEVAAELVKRGQTQLAEFVMPSTGGKLTKERFGQLDSECFSFLNRALESTLAPIVIFATKRGRTKIVGTDIEAAHGIPIDLFIICTSTSKLEEMRRIIEIRAETEKIGLPKEDAGRAAVLDKLAAVAAEKSLRCALLTPAKILAEADQLKEITVDNVEEAAELFIDIKHVDDQRRERKGILALNI